MHALSFCRLLLLFGFIKCYHQMLSNRCKFQAVVRELVTDRLTAVICQSSMFAAADDRSGYSWPLAETGLCFTCIVFGTSLAPSILNFLFACRSAAELCSLSLTAFRTLQVKIRFQCRVSMLALIKVHTDAVPIRDPSAALQCSKDMQVMTPSITNSCL